MDLKNKTIVITGATKGLGRELAIHLSRKPVNLILIARNKNLLERVQQEITTFTGKAPLVASGDISSENDVKQIVEIISAGYKNIDVLINNAGIGIHKTMEKITNEEMKKLFEVNFYGAVYCIKTMLPLLKQSKTGYILNIGSLAGEIAFADNSIYAASKSALSCFTSGLRREMKKINIKVGLFLPGLMKTSFQNDRQETSLKHPNFLYLDVKKAAVVLEKMIHKRKETVFMYKWMLLFMRIKQLFSQEV